MIFFVKRYINRYMSATDITCDTRFLSQVSNMTEKMCVNNCEKTEEENTPHVAEIYIK